MSIYIRNSIHLGSTARNLLESLQLQEAPRNGSRILPVHKIRYLEDEGLHIKEIKNRFILNSGKKEIFSTKGERSYLDAFFCKDASMII